MPKKGNIPWNYIPKTVQIERIKAKCDDFNLKFLGFETEKFNNHAKIILECNVCNRMWLPTIDNFVNKNTKCPSCKMKNRIITDEIRKNIRAGVLRYIKNLKGQISPRYNPTACQIFDEMMQSTDTFIKHEENGGEYYIKELGYFVDGYDEKNNIVYEYDEKHHFKSGQLCQKDVQRQKEIESFLGCTFIRIKA